MEIPVAAAIRHCSQIMTSAEASDHTPKIRNNKAIVYGYRGAIQEVGPL